jgi:hypothetical protein
MEALSVAAGNAAEIIGESLVNALLNLSGATNASDLGKFIENVAGYLAGLVDSIAKFVYVIKWTLNPKNWFKNSDQMWAEWDKMVQKRKMSAAGLFNPKNNAVTGYTIDDAARIKAEKDAKARAKALADATKKNTAELKKQAVLKKAGSIFDLEQIQLIAALKGQLSDEDRKRVELQFALITGNTSEAKKLTYELAIAQGLTVDIAKDLASLPDAKNPFASWGAYLDSIMEKARAVASASVSIGTGQGGSVIDNYIASIPQSNVSPLPSTADIARLAAPMSSGSSTIGDYLNVTLQIDGKTIASALQDTSLSGIPSSVNRTLGSFGR